MTGGEQPDTQTDLMKWWNSNMSDHNAEHQLLISEIARPGTMKTDLEAEVIGAVFVR